MMNNMWIFLNLNDFFFKNSKNNNFESKSKFENKIIIQQ